MSLSHHLKYASRHVVREGRLAEFRAHRLQSTEKWSADRRKVLRDELLHSSLARAAESIPAYSFLRGKVPRTGLTDFIRRNLPIVDKADLIAQRSRYYPRGGQPLPWWSVGKTSGTTGTPLDIFRSLDSTIWEHAFHVQHWRWAGFRMGERQVVLRGDLIVPVTKSRPPYWFHDRLGRQLFVSSRHLNDEAAPHIGAAIAQFGATQLRAYPSTAYELARLTEAHQLPIRFRTVITSSEVLYPIQREGITRVLGGQVFDFYGAAERTAFAAQCEHGNMHLHPDYSFVEIVDARGRPTNEQGFLVGTTFRNLAMPLLRYRLDDLVRWSQTTCPCGRSYPVIEVLGARLGDQVFDLDGVAVSPGVITFAFKGVHNLVKSQVAQVDAKRWVLRVVPGPHFSDADRETLLTNFRTLVSPRLNVEVLLVGALPNPPSGKFKWVVQEWKQEIASKHHVPG
jgi:phenylacetate-CoA ligase